MDGQDFEAHVAGAIRRRPGPGHRLRTTDVWLYLSPAALELPPHGWKLHVSSRAADYAGLVDLLLPVLLDEPGCSFKLARSHTVLTRLNNGCSSPATVGKAFTVYGSTDRIHDLGLRLARLLRGRRGPRVLSDRPVAPDAPVYYRYGPFTSTWGTDERARLVTFLHGPNPGDEEFGSLATLRYRQPSWTVDPFTGRPGTAEGDGAGAGPDEAEHLGGHYRLTEGIVESGRGNVFRAVDERDGSRVIVKQARALVDETESSGDARLRVRNERRVRQALTGVEGVSRFVDHFRHGEDEYLVTDDAGRFNLAQDLTNHGRYAPSGSASAAHGARSLERLAERLATVLLDVHARGVLMRDLTPRNVIVGSGGSGDEMHDRLTVIDFGLADFAGLHLPGGTPGYAPARQRRRAAPEDTDDFFGLGMTLLYAESNVNPLSIGEDLELAAQRALQYLHTRYGARPIGVMGAIADLLGLDEPAREAAAALAKGNVAGRPCATAPLPAAPPVTDELAAEICDSLLADVLDQSRRAITAASRHAIAHDACVYSGAAGPGLELLHHLDRPGVRENVAELAGFAVRVTGEMNLPDGYLAGRTGAGVFLARAAAAGVGLGGGYDGLLLPDTGRRPEDGDMMVGAAGIGIGHLVRYDHDGRAEHLGLVRRCAEAILDGTAVCRAEGEDVLPPEAAVETSAGRAHGLAGTVEFLLSYAGSAAPGERPAGLAQAAEDRARLLLRRAGSLLGRLPSPRSAPLAASWCQGMAGIAQTLLRAADALDAPEFAVLAGRIGDACIDFLPHVSVTPQCCGLAGIGNILIDLAERADSGAAREAGIRGAQARAEAERYWAGARTAAQYMLLRGAGSARRPVFVADAPEDGSASWAFGNAGILGFFRRLRDHGGAWSLPMPATGPVLAGRLRCS
jgi:hypothetical protein